jgi:23S rRNA maturation mini-RNase III
LPTGRTATHPSLQAAVHDLLRADGLLGPEEAAVLRWAANSATVAAPRHATRLQYKKATAVEVLVRAPWTMGPIPRLDCLDS